MSKSKHTATARNSFEAAAYPVSSFELSVPTVLELTDKIRSSDLRLMEMELSRSHTIG
jgi:hypothetical protein